MHFIWVSMYSMKVLLLLLGTLFLYLLLETGPPFYIVIQATQAKVTPSILSYFKTLSIGLALGIKPLTSYSAVKCSTD